MSDDVSSRKIITVSSVCNVTKDFYELLLKYLHPFTSIFLVLRLLDNRYFCLGKENVVYLRKRRLLFLLSNDTILKNNSFFNPYNCKFYEIIYCLPIFLHFYNQFYKDQRISNFWKIETKILLILIEEINWKRIDRMIEIKWKLEQKSGNFNGKKLVMN